MSREVPSFVTLEFPSTYNFRQGPNECGPYATSAFIEAAVGKVSIEKILRDWSWRLPGGYTHPRAIESTVRLYGIAPRPLSLRALSDEEKIRFLQEELWQGGPLLLLVKMYGYQHYITLLGYNRNTEIFFVYNSLLRKGEEGMTADDNGMLPGNRNISAEELLAAWSQGGIAGFYTWYALTGSFESSFHPL